MIELCIDVDNCDGTIVHIYTSHTSFMLNH